MSSFKINDQPYDIPTFDTFDLDEAEVFFNNCGFPIEDLVLAGLTDEEVGVKFRSPAVIRTLMQVAYQRAHPEMARGEVDAMLRKSNYADALAAVLGADDEADADPLAQTQNEPDGEQRSSGSNSASSNGSSGESSGPSSDEPAIPLAATGTTG